MFAEIVDNFPQTRAVIPQPDHFRLLKQHKVFCGVHLYNLKIITQEVSLNYVNAWSTIVPAMHLYSAIKQKALVTGEI